MSAAKSFARCTEMSRLGKRPVAAPKGVTIAVNGQKIDVKGRKGALSFQAHDDVSVPLDGGSLVVKPRSETNRARALWGTTRAIVAAQVKGVTDGFEKVL